MRYNEGTEASNPERQMFKVQYKSVLSGQWCESHLGNFSSQRRAANAAAKELATYETRVVSA